jgi:ATP-dependent exoDNAse (exonuclease V) beta subunit
MQAEKQEIGLDVNAVLANLAPLPFSEAPEWKKATDFIEQENEGEYAVLGLQAETAGVSAITRGSVLHRCLETFTMQNAYDLDAIMQEFPELASLEHDARQVFIDDANAVLQSVLNRSDLGWIFEHSKNSYSELPFLHKKENFLVSGIIDRVVIKGDTGYVVDYKAIRIENNEALATWTSHYHPQIQIYCSAVQELFGLKSVEGYLLFLDSNTLQLTSKA